MGSLDTVATYVGRGSWRLLSLAAPSAPKLEGRNLLLPTLADFSQGAEHQCGKEAINASIYDCSGARRRAAVSAQRFLVRAQELGRDAEAGDNPEDAANEDDPRRNGDSLVKNIRRSALIGRRPRRLFFKVLR